MEHLPLSVYLGSPVKHSRFASALIQARIAAGLSQNELARRLGLKEQQIQRYETTDYASAKLTRLRAVMQALGVEVRMESVVVAGEVR